MGGLTETPSRGRVLAILGFHKIGGPPAGGWDTWFYVSEATFSSFLSQLQEGAWRVIDLQTFLVGLAAPASLPTRSALLTFDDGYRSMRQIALPWLRDRKSTRLNSSHSQISYAVFCLKKKTAA